MGKLATTALVSLAGLVVILAPGSIVTVKDAVAAKSNKKCLYVSSYHRGYKHSDDIEAGLRAVLAGHCEIRQFDMDTKRRKSVAEKKARARAAKAIIDSWQPDVVITSDDNAAKYLIKPYYKNHRVPFVFCGLNWTAKEYGFPYRNATGMIEVGPIRPMLERAMRILPSVKRVFYIGADVLSESKNLKRFQRAAAQLGFRIDHALVPTTEAWLRAYERAQEYDLVVIGSRNGIRDWDHDRAEKGVMRLTRKLSVTNHDWMMPYTILGVTKVSREQGEWAGKTAIRILRGMSPRQIPVVPNQRRDIWINKGVLSASNMNLPSDLMRKGKKIARSRTN